MEIANNDSLFYLNRIVKDVPDNPEIVLRNQAQFLSKTIVKQDGGMYLFIDPFDYLLLTQADLGVTWNFTNNISAEVTNILIGNIFGVQDSVKTISLSDGNEIWLSKNFGILKFPDFENGGYFELVGLQDTNYGEQVIDFWDIFDFEVGDVFQYYGYDGDGDMDDSYHERIKIESKEILATGINYFIHKIRHGVIHDHAANTWTNYGYTEYTDLQFADSTNYPANYFNNQIVKLWSPYYPGYNLNLFTITKLFKDSLDVSSKRIGIDMTGVTSENVIYSQISLCNDTLLLYNNWFENEAIDNIDFKQGLGIVNYAFLADEVMVEIHLEGYIKSGDTVGIVNILPVGIKSKITPNNTFNIFPNPCINIVNFKTNDEQIAFPVRLELRNTQGLIVKEILISKKDVQVDISGLSQGIYFYSISSQNKIIQSGKLIVQ